MPYLAVFFILMVGLAAGLLAHHARKRSRVYRDLVQQRQALLADHEHEPEIAVANDPKELHPVFEREFVVRVNGFLDAASLERLRSECRLNRERAERSFIPTHKKGGTLSYEAIHRHAPACLGFYHSLKLRRWLSEVVGEKLVPTADHDQSSCSILYYDEAGDHIHWHYDHNFYRGRHFTVLLSLINRSPTGEVSAGKLMQRKKSGEEVEFDTSENVLVIFEGGKVLHRASPIAAGDERMMLSMTFSTNPTINPIKEMIRRIKDTAYYGPRALID